MAILPSADATLECYNHDDKAWSVHFTSGDDDYDLTGLTASWVFSTKNGDRNKLQLDVTDHAEPTEGLTTLELTPANITTLGGPGNYNLWCVLVDDADDEITRLFMTLVVHRRTARTT